MNVVLSPVSIPDLVNQIANEIEARLQKQQPFTQPPTTPDPIRLHGDAAASSYLGCSIMTIQSLRRSGTIPFFRTGRKVFYLSTELDAALKVSARKFGRKTTQV